LAPGAESIIHWLQKEKIERGVISNADLSWARNWIKHHGLSINPRHIFLSHEAGIRKPTKKIFDLYYKKMKKRLKNLQRGEILMIGDKDNDLAAKKAGFQTCLYNPYRKKLSKFKFEPDFVISHFSELKSILS
jgi:FMN phosphatase YigB (HAD superfamily)